MPQFIYRGRDQNGQLRIGQRLAVDADALNIDLVKEGIFVIDIKPFKSHRSYRDKLQDLLQSESLHLEELAVFARQLNLLQQANVPMVTSLNQLAAHTRSYRLANAIRGVIGQLEKGQNLAASMQHYPNVFSPLITSIVQIGESTGQLSKAFEHIHHYITFELNTRKQLRSAFRYPLFVLIAIVFAFIILNTFVIPTFARFYVNLEVNLPWQTRFLIGLSNLLVKDGLYLLIGLIITGIFSYLYLNTVNGRYRFDRFELRIPIIGRLLKRIILIRMAQSLSIIIKSGLSVTQGLLLIKNMIKNTYVSKQISGTREAIERGVSFTKAIESITLFSPLETQILSVGERNGELSPALNYIAEFQEHEIEYDLKRMSDFIGPALLGIVSILILIIALGVYLPIWNMVNLMHA